MSAKGVGRKELFGISQKLKPFSRDNEVGVSPHETVRTVAIPSYNASGSLDTPSDFPAVAPAIMHYCLRIHSQWF